MTPIGPAYVAASVAAFVALYLFFKLRKKPAKSKRLMITVGALVACFNIFLAEARFLATHSVNFGNGSGRSSSAIELAMMSGVFLMLVGVTIIFAQDRMWLCMMLGIVGLATVFTILADIMSWLYARQGESDLATQFALLRSYGWLALTTGISLYLIMCFVYVVIIRRMKNSAS